MSQDQQYSPAVAHTPATAVVAALVSMPTIPQHISTLPLTISCPAPKTTETVSTVSTDYTTVYPTASYGNDYTSKYDTTVVVPTTYATTLTITVHPSATGGKQSNGQPQTTSAKETVPAKETEPVSGKPWTVTTSTEVETEYTTVYPTASRYTSNGKPQISSWDELSLIHISEPTRRS